MVDPSVVRLLDTTACDFYVARYLKRHFRLFPDATTNHWHSLGVLCDGYVFERQGRPADYATIAATICTERAEFSFGADDGMTIWALFTEALAPVRLQANAKNNPLCCTGDGDSLPELEVGCGSARTLVATLAEQLREGAAGKAHASLVNVRGIGPKIASFILRDLALKFEIDCRGLSDRYLLQPIDVWIHRFAIDAFGVIEEAKTHHVASAIVDRCANIDVDPERANAGAWYVATQVAGGSQTALGSFLNSAANAREMLETHRLQLEAAAHVTIR